MHGGGDREIMSVQCWAASAGQGVDAGADEESGVGYEGAYLRLMIVTVISSIKCWRTHHGDVDAGADEEGGVVGHPRHKQRQHAHLARRLQQTAHHHHQHEV